MSARTVVPMSRRRFLHSAAMAAAGALLTACAAGKEAILPAEPMEPAFTGVTLPSPPAQAGQEEGELAEFLALSELLTGVEGLDPATGAIYLQSLKASSQFSVSVADLLAQARGDDASLPATLEDLESRGLFAGDATRTLADKITEYWYTGIYDTAEGEQAVATFVDSLAWRSLAFTKPLTLCGSYRFWTEPPEANLD